MCGKTFAHPSDISELHDCQKCHLTFPSLEDHWKHIQECHPKEFHQCPECNKMFTNPVLLEKHIAVHAGGTPYNCKLCQKSYLRERDSL
ncbi:zinc finger and BTB domain-containing protein 40-like [Salvelinus namaycush]|uniref:Zinc finger and BTB domain-containing protein 40-like n=1 Tax=Salvelinus namaycush TaxID=8040 RepID=A0A8U1F954_SALNM|nr:zinc finger and BTB domain-containing protein 40-like [Salvelinus namaycush]